MPFTLAHPAAAWPVRALSGDRLVTSALVVGSMSPDFEYLVHLSTRRTIGHDLVGVLVLCLPASLLVLLVVHHLVQQPVLQLAHPAWGRLAGAADRPFPLIGLWVARWARRVPDDHPPMPPIPRRRAVLVGLLASALLVGIANAARALVATPADPKAVLVAAVLGSLAGACLAVLAYALAVRTTAQPDAESWDRCQSASSDR